MSAAIDYPPQGSRWAQAGTKTVHRVVSSNNPIQPNGEPLGVTFDDDEIATWSEETNGVGVSWFGPLAEFLKQFKPL